MSEQIYNGGPAFPGGHVSCGDGDAVPYAPGMSKRDWFAGQALAGACIEWCRNSASAQNPDAAVAKWAYEIADAMIAESKKEPPHE